MVLVNRMKVEYNFASFVNTTGEHLKKEGEGMVW
jgi:hypothetical protein